MKSKVTSLKVWNTKMKNKASLLSAPVWVLWCHELLVIRDEGNEIETF
jgi:hypothetical protein